MTPVLVDPFEQGDDSGSIRDSGEGGEGDKNINGDESFDEEWQMNIIQERKEDGTIGLDFDNYQSRVDDCTVRKIFNQETLKGKKVTRIALGGCINITDITADIISTHCNSLEIVGLRGCHNLTDAGIAAIISNNSQLGVIIISYCFRATNESINAVVSGCPRIEEIVAIGVGFTSLPEDMFDNLPRLVYLNLSKNKISRLPKSIIRMSNECHIFLSGNPLKYPPLETVEQGMGAITSYFKHHRQLGV
mmetsp:Transcript_6176/g.9074  ORF Transcript_6176/g.9074 Transcript_6176/m.9074 type:complete len:248 (+) Transcript_6176:68-811(+)